MKTWPLVCAGCGEDFEAKSPSAKWCGSACRKRVQRKPESAVTGGTDVPNDEPTNTGLVDSVQRELEKADRVNTFAGQLALTLARRLPKPDESGISSLSKELRTVMAAALEGVQPPSGEGKPTEDEDDEVTRARRQREEARQAAGLG